MKENTSILLSKYRVKYFLLKIVCMKSNIFDCVIFPLISDRVA